MNKKLNTALFLLLGTVLNIVLMLVFLVLFIYLAGFVANKNPESQMNIILFFGSVLLAIG